MTVSIANMSQAWLSNSYPSNAISMSVFSVAATPNAESKLFKLTYNSNTAFNVDANGVYQSLTTTFAALPLATSSLAGSRSFVIDANTSTFNNPIEGGGSNRVPVFCDGFNWKVG